MHGILVLFIMGIMLGNNGLPELTDAQKEAGWKLLFDGKSFEGWRAFKGESFPEKGWVVDEGALHVQARGGGGDIVTTEEYGDFDLILEWKVSPKANSGIMFRVSEDNKAPWHTGPEFQIFDDKGHKMDPDNPHSSGALYGLYNPPRDKPIKPAGEWNTARIILEGDRLQQWHNGVLAVEADLSSEDYARRRDASKFSAFPRFGLNRKGFLCLQDHGNDVWFRNIRIRELKPEKEAVALFNGRNLEGWTGFHNDGGKMEEIWGVDEGILVCSGNPVGYIKTEKEYESFILKLEWRFSPVTKKAGNSGVLLRQIGPDEVWPKCVEAQLMSGNAGDFWNIGEFEMKTDPDRTKGRNTKKTHGNEHAVGQWNAYEIIVDKGDITLIVNGEVLNRATDVKVVPGRICLQSEGAEIHFRKIRLLPL